VLNTAIINTQRKQIILEKFDKVLFEGRGRRKSYWKPCYEEQAQLTSENPAQNYT